MAVRTIDHPLGSICITVDESEVPDARGTEPLMVLHGLGDSGLLTFRPILTTAFPDRTIVSLDLPGHGRSTAADPASLTVERVAESVADVMDVAGLAHAALVGHSLGGNIAIAYATHHPDRVDRLIVAEALLNPSHSRLAQSLARRSASDFRARGYSHLMHATTRQAARGDVAARSFVQPLRMADPLAMHALAASLVRDHDPSFVELLAHLTMPITFLIGGRTDVPLDIVPANVIVERIPDAGHAMMTEQPVAFLDAVRRALKGAGPPKTTTPPA